MSKAKKIKPKPTITYAPVWTDTSEFHLHPTCDRLDTKPPDVTNASTGRTITFIRVRITPITPITPKRKAKKGGRK